MKEKKYNCQCYLWLTIILFTSCSRNLDYIYHEARDTEIVNGFTVLWANETTDEKKTVIREILGDMVHVEGGYITMGVNKEYDACARENESPAHVVKLNSFYICAHELTINQITTLVPNPSSGYIRDNFVYWSYSGWEHLIEIMRKYTGLNFDFPTEAQWEYAARGGNKSLGYIYPGSNDWDNVWSNETESSHSIENELGIFNMADGRAEWCKDMYDNYKNKSIAENPYQSIGKYHVVKGGCSKSNSADKKWSYSYTPRFSDCIEDYRNCRSTSRSYEYNLINKDITWRPVIITCNNE